MKGLSTKCVYSMHTQIITTSVATNYHVRLMSLWWLKSCQQGVNHTFDYMSIGNTKSEKDSFTITLPQVRLSPVQTWLLAIELNTHPIDPVVFHLLSPCALATWCSASAVGICSLKVRVYVLHLKTLHIFHSATN